MSNNTMSRRARKRAAARAKQTQLSSARAILALECDGYVPEQWRGLNLHNTLGAIETARYRRGQKNTLLFRGST